MEGRKVREGMKRGKRNVNVGNFRMRKWRAAKRIGVPCILRITDSMVWNSPAIDFDKQDRAIFIIFNQVIFFFFNDQINVLH